MNWFRVFSLALAIIAGVQIAAAAQAGDSLLMPESRLPAKKTIAVFGQKIAYYDAGSGPVVVLVHGFGTEARFDWGNVILPLASHHRVIALDQIGFGASDKPLIDYSVQTYVDFLGEFLRTLKIKNFTLVGESLGGWISALYTIESLGAANNGAEALPPPSKLVLDDAAGVVPLPKGARQVHVAGSLEETKSVAVMFHDKSRVTDEVVRQIFAMRLKANDGSTQRLFMANPKLDREVVGDRLDAITIPTLVVWGGNDDLLPLEQGRTYANGIRGAKLVIIPESGHEPSVERPKMFLDNVLLFIN